MANKHRGEVEVNIGGKDRVLKLTLNDFTQIQDRHDGKPLMEILSSLEKVDVKTIRFILFLACKHEDKTISEQEVGEFEDSLQTIIEVTTKCITLSLNGPDTVGKSVPEKKPEVVI